jgi:mono/diheme cytochrome c family protein
LPISRRISQLTWIAGALTAFAIAFLVIASAADRPAPTFSKEVAPILFKNCANCHRPGQIASAVSFLSYDTALPWAKSIKEKVLKRQMPPWPADQARSLKFRNDARLSRQDIDTLVAWVNAGAPRGKDSDLPPVPSFVQGWLHPNELAPDLVISLPEFQLPATGEIPYLRHLVKVPLTEDKWVAAIQVRPGNPAIVHHMAITEIALEDGVTPADLDRDTQIARQLGIRDDLITARPAVATPANPAVYDLLGVYTPGTTFEMYRDGSAKLLRGGKNFYLNFNIHYQTTGKRESDRSMLAFWFLPEPPKQQLFRVPASGETIIANGKELLTDAPGTKAEGTGVAIPPVPPHAENYEVIGITAYTEPVTIYQFQPHAHLRGKDFKYDVVYPDGREETVLTVPKYDFHWQLAYDLDSPLKLPAGSKLVVTAHYDNSLKNDHLLRHGDHNSDDTQHNFGPEKEVFFREQNQSWDEMFSPFIQFSIDSQDPSKFMQPQDLQRENANVGQHKEQPPQNALAIDEVVGCLQTSPSGMWMLTNASDPIVSNTQSTSLTALRAAAPRTLGNQQDRLLGVNVFNPSSHNGQKVAVKGVLIKDAQETRLNVTSLQMLDATCF